MGKFYILIDSVDFFFQGSGFRFKLHGTREKARILKSDVVASNGIIHIINSLLTSQPDEMGNKSVSIYIVEQRLNLCAYRLLFGWAKKILQTLP